MLLVRLIDLYILIVFFAALGTWFDPRGKYPVVAFLYRITEPVLVPIRKIIPQMGTLDISPFVLMMILLVIKRILTGILL